MSGVRDGMPIGRQVRNPDRGNAAAGGAHLREGLVGPNVSPNDLLAVPVSQQTAQDATAVSAVPTARNPRSRPALRSSSADAQAAAVHGSITTPRARYPTANPRTYGGKGHREAQGGVDDRLHSKGVLSSCKRRHHPRAVGRWIFRVGPGGTELLRGPVDAWWP